jgi:glycosyltransferase involved in cell wall biosynthesis
MILFLHNRYRTTGGEERAVEDLMWLVREHLGEEAELLARDSESMPRGRAARGLIGGGLDPAEVERAVRRTGARIVHAHNLNPSFGWRALAAARRAGARTILHLHQYRLVCAVGVCFTEGADCTRCHGRHTLPGIRHNCRGSRAESALYAAALALWQRRMAGQADAFAVPSAFALERLRTLGAPVDPPPVHILPHVVRELADHAPARRDGPALLVSRLAPEKGVDIAIEACRMANLELIVAGDGPERAHLEQLAGAHVRFLGRVPAAELGRLRAEASLGLAPSGAAETFGLAVAEAMAAGLPVAGSRIGALSELIPEAGLAAPGDPAALAAAIGRVRADPQAGESALQRVRGLSAPAQVTDRLRALYSAVAPR